LHVLAMKSDQRFQESAAKSRWLAVSRRGFFTLVASLAAPAMPNGSWAATRKKIVALGDSLTAGLGLPADAAFPAQLQAALAAKGVDVSIENAGVSGDTTIGGLERLDWAIGDEVHGVIVELGANDALRGLPPEGTEKNLDEILTRLKARNIPVLLTGMLSPPNNGPQYQQAFDGIFQRLAQKHGVALYPFFLDGVAANPKLNQPDGIHPTREGVAVIVARMLPTVEAWLGSIK
jgi:acyl-CoA thioesterase I